MASKQDHDGDRKYYVTYNFHAHPEGVTKAELKNGDGATDALLFFSMLYPSDGSFSLAWNGVDGRTGKLVDVNELWKVWTMMTARFIEDEDLAPWKREFCQITLDALRRMLIGAGDRQVDGHPI